MMFRYLDAFIRLKNVVKELRHVKKKSADEAGHKKARESSQFPSNSSQE